METLRRKHPVIINPSGEELILVDNLKNQLEEYLFEVDSTSDGARDTILKFINDSTLLLRYIRGRKRNLRNAQDSIIRYAQLSADIYPDLFPAKIPEGVRLLFELKLISVLRESDGEGRLLLKYSCVGWDPKVSSMNDVITAGILLVEWLMDEFPSCLESGVIMILNAEGVAFNQVRQFTVPAMIKFVNVFMRAYPIPIKGVYYVNCPRVAKPVYAVIKPFLPKKLTDRTIVSSDVKELHKRISVEILPKSLGGLLAEEEEDALMPLSFLELPEE